MKHALLLTIALGAAAASAAGCMKQAQQVMGPDPEAVGTLSCREITENCDAQCTDPICVNKCTEQGTKEAQPQHIALVDCGQRNGCTDANCMQANCPQEIQTCMGTASEETSQPQVPPAENQGPSQESQQTQGQ